MQCGFCTPGLVMATVDLLEHVPSPTDDEIREALSGNICRCTGYVKIVEAVLAAAATLRGETPPPPGAGGLLAARAATVGGIAGSRP